MGRGLDRQTNRSLIRRFLSVHVTPAVLSWLVLLILAITALLVGWACQSGGQGPFESHLDSITVTPARPSIAVGTTIQLHATANYSDGHTEDITADSRWSSADTGVAGVTNVAGTTGLCTGAGVGRAFVTATQTRFKAVNGPPVLIHRKAGSTEVTVTSAALRSITVEPANPVVEKGTKVQLTATGTFSDATTQDLTSQLTWTSGNNGIAQVSNIAGTKGQVTGVSAGNTPITASPPFHFIQGSTTVMVKDRTLTSITVTPANPTIARSFTVNLTATCNFSDGSTQDCTRQVIWTSSKGAVAQVSNASSPFASANGLVTGLGIGSCSISAALSGLSGSTIVTVTHGPLTSITVTPVNPIIANGTTVQLTAIGRFSDGGTENLTSQVSWTSADNSIAQVSNVAGTQGIVTGLAVGNTPITAALEGVRRSTTVTVTPALLTSITVTPVNPTIANGTTVHLTATGTFSDGTTENLTSQVSWTSADDSIAQVSNVAETQGMVTGLAVGNTPITAALEGVTGSTTVTVTAATLSSIVIIPPDPSIAKGTTVQLMATGIFSDQTSEDLTSQVSWTSADNSIAQVSDAAGTNGLVTGTGVGGATMFATLEGVSGSTTVTVSDAVLTSIAITPADQTIRPGTNIQLKAVGTFSDGTLQDITSSASWISSHSTVATVGSAGDNNGLVTGIYFGSAAIAATQDQVSGSTVVTVSSSPPPPTPGATARLNVTSDTDDTISVFW
jgi:trimeric autotransporter adhesin